MSLRHLVAWTLVSQANACPDSMHAHLSNLSICNFRCSPRNPRCRTMLTMLSAALVFASICTLLCAYYLSPASPLMQSKDCRNLPLEVATISSVSIHTHVHDVQLIWSILMDITNVQVHRPETALQTASRLHKSTHLPPSPQLSRVTQLSFGI